MKRFKKILLSFVTLEACSIVVMPLAYYGVVTILRKLLNDNLDINLSSMPTLLLWFILIVATVMLEYIFSPNAKKILDAIALVIIKKVSYIIEILLSGELNARYLLLGTLCSAIVIPLIIFLPIETVLIILLVELILDLHNICDLVLEFEFETTVIPLDFLIKSIILVLLTV